MKIKKRITSLVLSVFVLFGTLPAISFANAETTITNVELSVMAPKAGRYPSYDARTYTTGTVFDIEDNSYGECQENGVIWFCEDTPLTPDTPFEIGKIYTVRLEILRADSSYVFSTNPAPTVTIDGKTAYIQYNTDRYISVEYTYPVLEGYTVSFSAGNGGSGTMEALKNVAGEVVLPECTFTPPNNKVFKAWGYGPYNEEFQPGEKIPVYENTTVYALWKQQSDKLQIFNIVATSADMDTIPTLYGRMIIPNYTIIEGTPAYINASKSNFRWQKKVGDQWENASGNHFTPGEWRASVAVRIDRDDAKYYELGNPTTLTVNGVSWTSHNGTGKPDVHPNYSQLFFNSPSYVIEDDPSVQPPVPLESVSIRLEGYQFGAPVKKAKAIAGNGAVITQIDFGEIIDADNDGNPEDLKMAEGNFVKGKSYVAIISFKAASGYDISGLWPQDVTLAESTVDLLERYSEDTDEFNGIYMLPPVECTHTYTTKVVKKATLNTKGKTQEVCSICNTKKTAKAVYKIKSVKLSDTSYTYNGKAKNPKVKVVDSKGNLISEKYYTVSRPKGRKKVGKYKVTVKFKTRYSGTKNLYFTIKPPKTSVSKLSSGKKSLKVTVKKQSEQTSGYQIQYSTSKKFAKSKTKSVTVKGYKNTKKTLKKLKANKIYYVRVRTYKTVDKTKYYSSWSATKYKNTK